MILRGSLSDTGDIIESINVDGYKSVYLQIVGMFSATYTACFSNDGENWKVVPLVNVSASSIPPAMANTGASLFWCPVSGIYFKLTVTNYSSGTVSAIATLSMSEIQPAGFSQFIVSNSILPTQGYAAAGTNNNILGKLISTATTNATIVKTSACKLLDFQATNSTSNAAYLKIYNAASITVGSTVPIHTFYLPKDVPVIPVRDGMMGKYLASGFCFAITAGSADTDATALAAAGMVTVNYSYV